MKNASELNRDWMKQYVRNVMNSIGDGSSYVTKELKCWNMYHSKSDNEQYNYLVKFGDFDIPVGIRFTSIVRPNIDYLTSKYLSNPFNFSTYSVDKKSLEMKYRQRISKYIESIEDRISYSFDTMNQQVMLINQKMQELQLMLQQQPENEEQAQQLQQLKQQLPMIELQMKHMTDALQREMEKESKKMNNIAILKKFSADDIREDFAYKKLRSMYEQDGIMEEHRRSFVEKCVTGRPYMFVDIVDGKLVYENVPATSIRHPKSTSTRYTEKGDWVAIDEYFSADYVMNRYGDKMNEDERKRIRQRGEGVKEVYGNNAVGYNYTEGTGGQGSYNDVRVTRIYWKTTARNRYKMSPSNGDTPHVHRYDGGPVKPTDKIEERYRMYCFEGVVVEGNIIVDVKPRDNMPLYNDNINEQQLPVIGDNYDDITRVPYSLIWVTRELQALNTIIEYHKELLLVISGVRGFIMDQSQLPEDMNKNEWMYYRKLGVMWIETYKKDRRLQPNFNQFQQFDDTLSGGIQYLVALQQQIQGQVDQITGVTRQARGDIQVRDLVGTAEMAIQATSIIADVLFWEHDQIIRRALTRALNLYCKFIGVKGDMFTVFDKYIGGYEAVNIPAGLLDGADFDVIVMNNNKNFRDIEGMKQVIMGEYGKGRIDLLGMADLMEAQSYMDMKKIAIDLVERANAAQSQAQQGQMDVQKELLKFENDLKMPMLEMEGQFKQLELNLKKLDLDLKDKQIIFEQEISNKKIESDTASKVLDILTEREIELKYLDEQKTARQVDDILEQARIITEAMLGKQTNEVKERVSMRPKERIKD